MAKISKMVQLGAEISESLQGFVNNNFLVKIIFSLLLWIVALTPMWLSFLIYWLIGSVDFWQKFATVVVCVFVFGGPQIFLGFWR